MKYFIISIFLFLGISNLIGQVDVSASGSEGVIILNMNATVTYTDEEADPIRITIKMPAADAPSASRPMDGDAGVFNVNTLSFSTVGFQGESNNFYYISYVADNPYRLVNMPTTSTNVFELSIPGFDFTNAVLEMGVDFGPEVGTKMEVNTVNQFNFLVPVELVFFKASKQDDKFSLLDWQTASEINNDFFHVERSANGQSFETIGKVLGNGTTTEVQNYEFLDRTPHAGLNYYRLKQVDFNGEYEYSKVETVDFRDGTEGDVAIFPNPAVDYVNVTLDRAYEGVKVINQLGQLVESLPSSQYESNQFKLDLSAYAPGVYFLEAKLGHEIVNKQFVKVK